MVASVDNAGPSVLGSSIEASKEDAILGFVREIFDRHHASRELQSLSQSLRRGPIMDKNMGSMANFLFVDFFIPWNDLKDRWSATKGLEKVVSLKKQLESDEITDKLDFANSAEAFFNRVNAKISLRVALKVALMVSALFLLIGVKTRLYTVAGYSFHAYLFSFSFLVCLRVVDRNKDKYLSELALCVLKHPPEKRLNLSL